VICLSACACNINQLARSAAAMSAEATEMLKQHVIQTGQPQPKGDRRRINCLLKYQHGEIRLDLAAVAKIHSQHPHPANIADTKSCEYISFISQYQPCSR